MRLLSPILITFLFAIFPPQAFANTDNPASNTGQYTINAGDYLRISVFGVKELSNDYRVDAKGRVTMPLIGEIPAEGEDKYSLQDFITKALTSGHYFNDPIVTVEVITLAPFYILGEVNTPGRYEYQPGLDLFKAVAIAGGYTPRARKGRAIIIRKHDGKKTKIEADELTDILPGDSIKIKQRLF